MKYLHIVPLDSQLVLPLIQMLQRSERGCEHEFMVTVTYQSILKNDPKMLCIKGLKCIPSFKRMQKLRRMLFILRQAEQADHVIWHSFQTNNGYNPLLLLCSRKLLAKSTWIAADGEIGNPRSVPNRFLNRFIPAVTRYVQRRLAHIGICFPSDRDILKAQGIESSKIVVLPYPIPSKRVELLQSVTKSEPSVGDVGKPKIQIGLTSQRGNNHFRLIEKLSGLTGCEEGCAFIPFHYFLKDVRCVSGAKKYQNSIRKKAATLPYRSIFLTHPAPQHSFLQYAEHLDAVFLANYTVCSLEFLLHLLAQRKKVFLPADSPLFIYLNRLGANIQPLEQLDEGGSLQEILDCPSACLPPDLKDYFQETRIAQAWADFFSA